MSVIDEEAKDTHLRDDDKEFIAQVYSYIFIGCMLDWIKDDMREEPESIVGRLTRLLKGSVKHALGRFRL